MQIHVSVPASARSHTREIIWPLCIHFMTPVTVKSWQLRNLKGSESYTGAAFPFFRRNAVDARIDTSPVCRLIDHPPGGHLIRAVFLFAEGIRGATATATSKASPGLSRRVRRTTDTRRGGRG